MAHASLFNDDEVNALATGGRQSITSLTRNHFQAFKNTGVGLYYGWKSQYSPARPADKNGVKPVLWTDAQRVDYVKKSVSNQFKSSFNDDAQLLSWVNKAVGVQETSPRSGEIQMTSCILWVMKHVEAAYNASGKGARWLAIRAVMKKNQDRAIVLMSELQKDGWEAVYWNPDVAHPDEQDANRRTYHTHSAYAVAQSKAYYPTWYTSSNPPPANEYIRVDHLLENYRPSPGSNTVQNLKGLNALKKVPFWVGLANFGEHSFVGYSDVISESHSPFMPNNRDNVQISRFQPWGEAWAAQHGGEKYLSGVIMVPPNTWVEE